VAKRKRRNYVKEYKRRIARGKRRGLTKAVSRGHAPKGTIGIKRAKQLNIPPGFVIGGQRGKGFVSSARSRAQNLRGIGLRLPRDVLNEKNKVVNRDKQVKTEQRAYQDFLKHHKDETTLEEFVSLLKETGFSEREAFTLWFS
jgi:hypothetical protein